MVETDIKIAPTAGDRTKPTDASRLDSNVSPRTDCNSDFSPGKCRRIIDPVADHGHPMPAHLQFLNLGVLVRGQHLGENLVDTKRPRNSVGYRMSIAGDHGNPDAAPMKSIYRPVRLRTNIIFDDDGTSHITIGGQVQHSRAGLPSGLQLPIEFARNLRIKLG